MAKIPCEYSGGVLSNSISASNVKSVIPLLADNNTPISSNDYYIVSAKDNQGNLLYPYIRSDGNYMILFFGLENSVLKNISVTSTVTYKYVKIS